MQNETQHLHDVTSRVDVPPVATLIRDIGMLLGKSECDIVECVEALTCVLGDAVAQSTNRMHSDVALSAIMLFVTDAYALGCVSNDDPSTIQ